MVYTLDQGTYQGSDRQERLRRRGLLIGLPILALVILIGAIIGHHSSNSRTNGAQIIPVVSNIKSQNSSSKSNNNSAKGNPDSNLSASASAQPAGGSSAFGLSTGSPGTSTGLGGSGSAGGTGGVIGGFGGGPVGGSGGSGGAGGTGTSIPNCSPEQIATVTCMVPACSPPVTLAQGQKAILEANGTCVVLN